MIRKQLYITEAQDDALKERARALGISEAEVARRALDVFLGKSSAAVSRRRKALIRLLEHTRDLASEHRLPSDPEFNRDALCADRGVRKKRRS